MGRFALFAGAALAIALVVLGIRLVGRPLGDPPVREPAPPPPAERTRTDFPAARATILPPREWVYLQRDNRSVAFNHLLPGAAVRFFVVQDTKGPEAHLALVRGLIPDAERADRALPDWPGAEGIAVSRPGDQRVGASWLLRQGDVCLQVLYWGDEERLRDIPGFQAGLSFAPGTK